MLKIRLSRLLPGLVALAALTVLSVARRQAGPGRRRSSRSGSQRELHDVPLGPGSEVRERQVDRRGRQGLRRIRARADAVQVHRLPQRRVGREAAARAEAEAGQLRGLPRGGRQGVRVDRARQGAQGRQHGRGHLHRLPRQARHPKSTDPTSRTHVANHRGDLRRVPRQRRRHQEGQSPGGNVVALYHDSIHGKKTNGGAADAGKVPICTDCHGAHNIRGKMDADSRVCRENIAGMCGSCHQQVYSRFTSSMHGQMRQAGNSAAPTCTDCHSAHGIRRTPRRNGRSTSSRSAATATAACSRPTATPTTAR